MAWTLWHYVKVWIQRANLIFHLGSKSIPSALCMLHFCREWPDHSHSPSSEMYTTWNGFSEEYWQSPIWWLGCTSAREPVRGEMTAIHWSLCNSCTKWFWANYDIPDPEDRLVNGRMQRMFFSLKAKLETII